MLLGFFTFELHIPHANSLKEKRMSLRSLKDRLKKLNVSFAEEENDLWQRTVLGVAYVSRDMENINSMYNEVMRLIEEYPELQIIDSKMEVL